MFTMRTVILGLLLWVAFVWCRDVWERRSEDFEELANSGEPARQAIIVVYWLITIAILIAVGYFVHGVARDVIAMFR